MAFWLMKTEPSAYSIDDLVRDGRTPWEGVRNYQARNLMRDAMRPGDDVLFYHSNATPPGVVGWARVASTSYPDRSAFDPKSDYFDPESSPENPRWFLVDVELVEVLPRMVTLTELKADPALEGMLVRQRGARLSVQPVDGVHGAHILALGGARGVARAATKAPVKDSVKGESPSEDFANTKRRKAPRKERS